MVLLLLAGAAGAAGLAGYAMGKRRERRQVENGYVTYHQNGYGTQEYGNLHYGKTSAHRGSRYYPRQQSGYYSSSRAY